jgi:hypothetical protein
MSVDELFIPAITGITPDHLAARLDTLYGLAIDASSPSYIGACSVKHLRLTWGGRLTDLEDARLSKMESVNERRCLVIHHKQTISEHYPGVEKAFVRRSSHFHRESNLGKQCLNDRLERFSGRDHMSTDGREARYPTHVVVDTIDGSIFGTGADGKPFDQLTATAFARGANAACKPGHKTYALFRLEPSHMDSTYQVRYTLSDDGKVVYPL